MSGMKIYQMMADGCGGDGFSGMNVEVLGWDLSSHLR